MKENNILKRTLAAFLAVAVLVIGIPFATFADEVPPSYTAITDPATVNNWKAFFGPNKADTTSAGAVWTDKSVFSTVNQLVAATDETENAQALLDLAMMKEENFLVALSTIAASKSVEGYSTLPTDTMLVLDLSASMVTNQAVDATVEAANDAMKKLLELNAYNRVGVIAYSGSNDTGSYSTTGTAQVILPLGRYTAGQNAQRNPAYLVSSWQSGNSNRTGVKVAPGVTGTVADDIQSTFSVNNNKQASGGTYIQNGLYQAWKQFEDVAETTITDGLQAGVKRVPVMVLLSDGAPTTATTDYTNIGTANSGDGSANYATPGVAFMTQLTASWVRDKMEQKYGTNPLFYTLGLKVDSSDAAQSVLNPAGNTATDTMWADYIALSGQTNQNLDVEIRPGYWTGNGGNRRWVNAVERTLAYTPSVLAEGWAENYVTEYFPASNAEGLIAAFEDIVDQIVLQSLYYPTLVEIGNNINEDGFLEFEDYIGKNMEVKSVKGIQLGEKLYTGRTLAKMIYEGGMGTQENPTEVGNNLVWSVQFRLGIPRAEDARALLGQAYANGQLYYNPETDEYSNYIGWYADGNGKFVGFWDGKDDSPAAVPAPWADRAVYAIKSYGYYDALGSDDSHRKTDMMYATIQVRTTLKDTAAGKIDASKVGDTRVIGRLPAALIPLVEYNIDLNGTDPLDPSQMTISGATAPSRLIYEVGLDEKIDLLDLENTAPDALEKEDGKYVFYTNEWHMKDQPNGIYDDYSYGTNKNTIAFFEPSVENERYYYNADTPIYTDTNGTLYKGAATPTYDANNLYYHRFIVYTGSGSNVKAEYHYEPVSKYVLEHESTDMARLSDGSWVVLRGTIYHHYGDYIVNKTENKTATLPVSDQPFVHEISVGAHPVKTNYHVDSYLGNNGKLLVDPYEGIKITKTADITIEDREQVYTFQLQANDSSFQETVTLVKEDATGERTLGTVSFANGVATVSIKTGEAAYVVGNGMIGKTFTVSEVIPADGDYEVLSVNGDANATTATALVASGVITTAAFINTKPQNGDVVITKTVVSPLESHLTKEFEFAITFAGVNQTMVFEGVRSDGQRFTLSTAGSNTVALTHGQALHIEDLPGGVTVNVAETDYSSVGFTANSLTGSATAVVGDTQYIRFTNTYKANSTIPPTNVTITGTKNLDADAPWATALQFEFQLQRYDAATQGYVDVPGGTTSVTYNNETGNKTFDLLTAMQNEVYPAVGTYSYRLIETINTTYVNNGIVYDNTPVYFDVVVSDNGLGQLYVSDVLAVADAVVTPSVSGGVNTWNVDATFVNQYRVNGAAEVVVNVDKTIAPTNGVAIPPSGFQFGLYHADGDFNMGNLVQELPLTNANGKTEVSLFYDEITQIGTQHFIIKEIVPANADDRIGYSQQAYGLKVIVGHVSGGYTITVEVYDLTNGAKTLLTTVSDTQGPVVLAEISNWVQFENSFTAKDTNVVLSGIKSLTGKAMEAFTFELLENGTVIKEATNGSDGTFAFPALSYSAPGTYTYKLREKIPAGADANHRYLGTTYDTTVYDVTVTVTGNNTTGELTAAVEYKLNGNLTDAAFHNHYTVDPVTDVVISGGKHLSGNIRKLQANAFHFELLENGTLLQSVGNGVPQDDYNATFAFEPLTFTKAGTYTYTVREHLPAGVTATNNNLNGVIYDTNEYTVTVVVTDQGDGTLHADVQYPAGGVQFHNAYQVSGTYIDLLGEKTLLGDDLSKYTGANAFNYELYAASYDPATQTTQQGALLATVTDNGTGTFRFDHQAISALNFTAIGGYRFIVKEQVPANADPLMDYDLSVYYVEIDVIDNLLGGLKATPLVTKVDEKHVSSVISDGVLRFTNELKVEAISVDLGGKKAYNKALTDGQFTFELYQAMEDAAGNVVAIGDPLLEAANKADGSFQFQEKLLTDELSGTQMMSEHMTFYHPGTYHFVIKEKLPEGVHAANKSKDGVIYDTNAYVVTVEVTKVTDNTGRDVLIHEVTANGVKKGTITVTNTYDPADAKVTLSGTKKLNGRNLVDDEFTFELYAVEGNGETLKDSKTNKGAAITFEELTFDQAGTYPFTVKEKVGTDATITYDSTVYQVTIHVVDENGTLKATVLVDNDAAKAITFANAYTPPAEPPVEPPVEPQPPVEEPPVEPQPPVEEPPVVEPPAHPSNPDTGDQSHLYLWIALLVVSGGLFGMMIFGKKKIYE